RLQLHAAHQPIAGMRSDCHVCRSEVLSPRSQVLVTRGERQVQALLYQTDDERFPPDQVALSEAAWRALGLAEGGPVQVRHPAVLASLAGVRRRSYGGRLDADDMADNVRAVVQGRYSEFDLAACLNA